MTEIVTEPDILIGTIQRPKGVEVRFMLRHWQGEIIADARTFVDSKKAGEIVPTQRGFTLALEQLEELRDLVDKMIEERDKL